VMDLGAAHCRARRPLCTDCPLLACCPTGKKGTATDGAGS
jgi:adenine-specific DNA glycosylase